MMKKRPLLTDYEDKNTAGLFQIVHTLLCLEIKPDIKIVNIFCLSNFETWKGKHVLMVSKKSFMK